MNTVLLNKPHRKIGIILKAYREKTGLNQAEIAKRAHISTSMLSQIERAVVSPSIDTLYAVCNALGMDITHLFRSISDTHQVRVRRKGERLKNSGNGVRYEQLVSTPRAVLGGISSHFRSHLAKGTGWVGPSPNRDIMDARRPE